MKCRRNGREDGISCQKSKYLWTTSGAAFQHSGPSFFARPGTRRSPEVRAFSGDTECVRCMSIEMVDFTSVKRERVSSREGRRTGRTCYTGAMLDELEFRRTVESALDALKRHLIVREEDEAAGFEVEEQNGVLIVQFED